MIGPAELAALAAQRRQVLKEEPGTTVLLLGSGAGAVVQKTYRVRGLRQVQSWWRRSRAQREHDSLAAIAAAGVPCLQPLGWSAVPAFFGFRESTLVTRFLVDSTPLKQVLRALPRSSPLRARLATAMGELVGALHRHGFLWCTPMPRNVLVVGDPARAALAVCDTPSCVLFPRSLHGTRRARIDLFLGAFSPSRRTDWSAAERLRWLRGYCGGDRTAARNLWRPMQRRSTLQNELERALAMAAFTYILARFRPTRQRTDPTR